MKTFIFCKDGKAVGDLSVLDEVDSCFVLEEDETFRYSTHMILEEVRARIREGRTRNHTIVLYVEDEHTKELKEKPYHPEHASCDVWYPEETVYDEILNRLLGWDKL